MGSPPEQPEQLCDMMVAGVTTVCDITGEIERKHKERF
jgi:hypothetical protein